MFPAPTRVNGINSLTVLLLCVGTGMFSTPASGDLIARYDGTSTGEIQLNPFLSSYTFAVARPGYNAAINQRPTGSVSGDGRFQDSDTQGTDGPFGVSALSRSSGQAGFNPPGSSATSSDSNLSDFLLFYTRPGILAFNVKLSLQTAVLADSPFERVVDYADIKVYVDATQVFGTSSVASSFWTGVSQRTGLNETTSLMEFLVPAGLHTVEVIPYTNGEVNTVPVAPTPEPSSIVMFGIGGATLVGVVSMRRRQ